MYQNRKDENVRKETFIAVDVESDGPIPGVYSMLSLGAVAMDEEGNVLSTFSENLETLRGARQDEATMKFWDEFPDAYAATRVNPKPPMLAMRDFVNWFRRFDNPVFVFYPAKFDATMIYWYMVAFVPEMNSFRLWPDMYDMKTMAAMLMRTNVGGAYKSRWPKRWKRPSNIHTHVALEDAVEQAEQFIKMYNEWKSQGAAQAAPLRF